MKLYIINFCMWIPKKWPHLEVGKMVMFSLFTLIP